MRIRVFTAILLCRTLRLISRLLHRGGTAMPGRWAVKVCPGLLSVLARGVKTVAITGTNGKTTSARMVEEAFSEQGLSYFANRSGANLMSGIVTEFVMSSTLSGRCRKEYAVIECDEAAARTVFAQLKPKVVLVTNLFRDQLDRYGEVTHTLENIRVGLQAVPEARLCLNADCSLTSSLADDLPNPAVFYGIDPGAVASREKPEISDATHCIRCKTEYEYDYITYGHLGGFRCPHCGYRRHSAKYAVTKVKAQHADGTDITMKIGGEEKDVNVNLPALYNVYNAAGAISAVSEMGLGSSAAVEALSRFRCGFGRMEQFPLGGGTRLMLVKNPAGCNQVIEFLENITGRFLLVICLNDRAADGKDVSWIWDADFEKLAGIQDRFAGVIVSGDRTGDMHVRMKYAGIDASLLSEERDYEKLVTRLSETDLPVFIMPTYTAMLDLRAAIVRHVGGTEFWE
ncbi:MAG: MurT ligase domain-containing protein [Oscillospiraceae bacterium]|nr:MurT ligase domain-containing protein [Oscillospiraceae bacterium]